MAGHPLLRTATGTLEDDIRPIAACHVLNGGNDITPSGVERMICTQFTRDFARLFADIDRDDQAGAAEPGDLQALQPHAPLAQDHDRISYAQLRRLDRSYAVAQRL